MSSSSSSENHGYINVYLSFCGRDETPFGPDIYTDLKSRGVRVFCNEFKLRGQDWDLTPSDLSIMRKSNLAIILFTSNYVNSRSCLEELEKIMECSRTTGLFLLPMFYDYSYSIREGKYFFRDPFGKVFHEFLHRLIPTRKKNEDKFMTWVAAISKYTPYDVTGYSTANVTTIITHVTHMLKRNKLFDAKYPVVQDVIQLLQQSEYPFLLGIWGMVGIGKTTIAQTVYKQIRHYFEASSFLDSFHDSLKEKFRHKRVLEKFRHKRVLLVLDNVTKLEQLNAFCGSREWFGAGSKIIITTRDRQLLKLHGVDDIYSVKELDQSESLEVFNSYAFKEVSPNREFVELSRQFAVCSGGLPLALSIIGSLMPQTDLSKLEYMLQTIKRFLIPFSQLQEALERSFNDLDDEEKQVFIDIACFFIGMDQYDVVYTLSSSTQFAYRLISLLEDKSFVTIDENNKLGVHVLLQAMAREIINRESRNKPEPKIFDVFLSFRGGDSRAKFISHLYSSLQNAGVYVFKDDEDIQRGDLISFALLQGIGHSRICVIVLSRNYANSRWCMLELEKIMEIGRTGGAVVVPLFYEVDPSEVRNQTGQFGKAFEDLISRISVDEYTEMKWRKALSDIGGIAGFVIIDSRNESEDIKIITEKVTHLLDKTALIVAEYPVGVESRLQVVSKLLKIHKAKDVFFLGIWGMGGIGKSTVAKAIYNQIGKEFEGRSFVPNIREDWEKGKCASLQQQVLCDIYKTTTLKIHDIESGKIMLKEKLPHKRILVLLDDVDDLDQLKALCGSREWFGPGSRIIITTRDMHILNVCGVNHVYKIEEMDESESLELFSWHAFKQRSPRKDFTKYSRKVIAYSGRLPLALEVLGSHLSDKGITEWRRVLEKLKSIPNHQVQKKLKISFDGLSDDTEKQIFLDIACFFIGMDRNDVILILDGCLFFANTGLNVLLERSLVTVDNKNKLRMHDLLRDMGREIVREESPYDPEKRSRLWHHGEVFDVLSKHTGTENVKGISLVELPEKSTICLNTKAFVKMNKLRLLQLAGVKLNGDFTNISGDLRWLYWHGFSSTYIPVQFQQGSLVAIELKYSSLKQTWRKSQMLESLKILNLSHSLNLVRTPDFSYLPNLEKLVLKDCPSLSTVSDTIGSLHKLLLINLTNCTGLRELPRSMYTIKSLETLILSGCSIVDKLEEDIEQMESLTTLIADRTAITKVPFSIVRSKRIGYISLCGFEGFSRDVFPSLIQSWMLPTNNVISLVQTFASKDLIYGSSYNLPSAFKDLLTLRSLCVECGSEVAVTQEIARILDVLKATNFQKFEEKATTSQISDTDTDASPLIDSRSPIRILGSKNFSKSLWIQMGMKCQVPYIAKDNISQTTDGAEDSFLLPDEDNPDCLSFGSHFTDGCSIKFEVPTVEGRTLNRMMLNIDYSSSTDNIASEGCYGVLIINYTKATIQVYKKDTLTSFEDEEWQSITSNLEVGNNVEVRVVFGEGFIVEKTIVYLLYDKPINREMENCHALDEENVIVSSNNNTDAPTEKNVTASGADYMPAETNITASSADIEKKVKSSFESSPPKGIFEEPGPSTLNLPFVSPVSVNDPVSVMDQLLSGEFGHSSKDIQTLNEDVTSKTNLSSMEAELEKLRLLAFSNTLFSELPNNQKLLVAISASIQYIESRNKDLTLQQYIGFSEFSKLFNKAIESINTGNIVNNHLSQLAYEEKEVVVETSTDAERKKIFEIETERKQIKDQIASLKEKSRLLKQEKKVLEEMYTSSKVKHEEAMNKDKDTSTTIFFIREKIAWYKNQKKENNVKYAELVDSYKRMKDFPPF